MPDAAGTALSRQALRGREGKVAIARYDGLLRGLQAPAGVPLRPSSARRTRRLGVGTRHHLWDTWTSMARDLREGEAERKGGSHRGGAVHALRRALLQGRHAGRSPQTRRPVALQALARATEDKLGKAPHGPDGPARPCGREDISPMERGRRVPEPEPRAEEIVTESAGTATAWILAEGNREAHRSRCRARLRRSVSPRNRDPLVRGVPGDA